MWVPCDGLRTQIRALGSCVLSGASQKNQAVGSCPGFPVLSVECGAADPALCAVKLIFFAFTAIHLHVLSFRSPEQRVLLHLMLFVWVVFLVLLEIAPAKAMLSVNVGACKILGVNPESFVFHMDIHEDLETITGVSGSV